MKGSETPSGDWKGANVEGRIKKALQPLWKVENILTELIDEYQPPEPYLTPILELHRLVAQLLVDFDMGPE
jgi:hypothetical protein